MIEEEEGSTMDIELTWLEDVIVLLLCYATVCAAQQVYFNAQDTDTDYRYCGSGTRSGLSGSSVQRNKYSLCALLVLLCYCWAIIL